MTAMTLTAPRAPRHTLTRPTAQLAGLTLLGAALLIPAGIAGVHGLLAALLLAATLTFVLNVPVPTELRLSLAVVGLAAISLFSAASMLSVMSAPACAVYSPLVAAFFYGGSALLFARFYLRR